MKGSPPERKESVEKLLPDHLDGDALNVRLRVSKQNVCVVILPTRHELHTVRQREVDRLTKRRQLK